MYGFERSPKWDRMIFFKYFFLVVVVGDVTRKKDLKFHWFIFSIFFSFIKYTLNTYYVYVIEIYMSLKYLV